MDVEEYVIRKMDDEAAAEIILKAQRTTCKTYSDLLIIVLALNGRGAKQISDVYGLSRQAVDYRIKRFKRVAQQYAKALMN